MSRTRRLGAAVFRILSAMPFLPAGGSALAAQQGDSLPPAAGLAPYAQTAGGGATAPLPSGISGLPLSWSGYFEALAILCFALALLWALLWLLKRRGATGVFSGAAPALRVESRLALGPKKWIIVVRCLDRRLVLGLTDEHISLLTEIFPEESEQKPQGPPRAMPEKTGEAKSAGGNDAPLDQVFASLLRAGKDNEN